MAWYFGSCSSCLNLNDDECTRMCDNSIENGNSDTSSHNSVSSFFKRTDTIKEVNQPSNLKTTTTTTTTSSNSSTNIPNTSPPSSALNNSNAKGFMALASKLNGNSVLTNQNGTRTPASSKVNNNHDDLFKISKVRYSHQCEFDSQSRRS